MEKQVIRAEAVPETGGPFNLCVRHGDMLYISGLPPFEEEYCALLRAARARGEPPPPFPDLPFERQVRIVMDHLKRLVEAAGSDMDCLLKVIVWLKDQRQISFTVPEYRCGEDRSSINDRFTGSWAPVLIKTNPCNSSGCCRENQRAIAPPME